MNELYTLSESACQGLNPCATLCGCGKKEVSGVIRMSNPDGKIVKLEHAPIPLVPGDQLRGLAANQTERIRQQLRSEAQFEKDVEARRIIMAEIGKLEHRGLELPELAQLREEVTGIGDKTQPGQAEATTKVTFASARAESAPPK